MNKPLPLEGVRPVTNPLPLEGIRVVEFSHMVMGPTCGLVLADLGAEVIKVEPDGKGDPTRYLKSTGAGFFASFSRNKKSVTLDLASEQGLRVAKKLIATADVFIENFRPGALDSKGLGYADLSKVNPRLIYCSLKGFLTGPYEKRTALDEVVQMMSGLAYMTGPVGRPLRAGAPVNDMMGGMFGAIAILAALRDRDRTGVGEYVQSGLFENAAWLVSTHMMQHAVSKQEPEPMSAGKRAWGVYDIFDSSDGVRIFIDSGDCLTILPDTAARRPCLRLPSNSPAWVVESKLYLSIANTLFGPTETRLLSVKVMPAELSAPVTTMSAVCRPEPTVAGILVAPRWISTDPFATLI